MASKIEKEMQAPGNVFDCPICLEQMKTPKYLPCLHTFCEVCLNVYIETSLESTSNASKTDFACPICRKSVQPPNQDLPVKDWAKNFPDNYLILTLMEKSGDHSENCGACWRQNKTSKSSFWCVSCAHPVCADCKNVHVMFNALKNHRIITLEEFRNQDIFPDIEYYCDQHSGKTVEVFCVDHTKLCCSVCFATKHRSCVDVKSLEDISETRNPKEDDILLEKLREFIQDTIEMEKEFQKMKQNLKQESEATVEKATQEVEKTKRLLAKKLDEFVCSHEKEAQEKINDLEKIEKAVDGFKRTANESFKMLSAVMEGSSQKQRFLVSHQITQLSNQTLQKIIELPSDVVAGYTYPTEEICQDIVRHLTFNGVQPTRKPIKGMQSLLNKMERFKSNQTPSKTDHQESEKMINAKECTNSGSEFEDNVEWICNKIEQNLNEKRDAETSQEREICETKCESSKSDNNEMNICSSSLGADLKTNKSEEITEFEADSIQVNVSDLMGTEMSPCKNKVTYLNNDSDMYTSSRSYQANLRHSTVTHGNKTEANHYLEQDTKPYWERNVPFGMTGNYEVGISDNQNKNMVSSSKGYQQSNASIIEGQKGYTEESKREKVFRQHPTQNMGTTFRGYQTSYASNGERQMGYSEENKTKEWFRQTLRQDTGKPSRGKSKYF